MKEAMNRDYLEGSVVVSWLRRMWGRIRLLSGRGWQRLLCGPGIRAAAEHWKQAPLRTGGLLLTAAILTNLLLLWILKKEIPWFGWLLRGTLLVSGIAALRCQGDWESVREGSVLLRFLFPRDSK